MDCATACQESPEWLVQGDRVEVAAQEIVSTHQEHWSWCAVGYRLYEGELTTESRIS